MVEENPRRTESLVGLTLLFAFASWLMCVALATSMALQRGGLAYAALALVVAFAAAPLAIMWAGRRRRRATSEDAVAATRDPGDPPRLTNRNDESPTCLGR